MRHLKSYKMFNEGFKDTAENEYSVQKVDDSYRIYVITPKMRQNNEESKDCEDVFGKGSYYMNYNSQAEAIEAIKSIMSFTEPESNLFGDFE